jgi:hypothetical protein
VKRWAKLGRPSGAAFSCAWFHQTVRKRVLTHTLGALGHVELHGLAFLQAFEAASFNRGEQVPIDPPVVEEKIKVKGSGQECLLYTRRKAPVLERVDPGDACPNDQRVDVMRPLVGFDTFEVHQMPHDGVIVGDAVGAQNVSR